MIKFLDLQLINSSFAEEFSLISSKFFRSGAYISGPLLTGFENEWSQYCSSKHCVGVGNGFDALKLTLTALGIGEGDEVIVPSHTFIATWLSVSHCGAIPIPVDIEPHTFNINPHLIPQAVTSKTKAIIPVHLYGQPCKFELITEIASEHNLFIISDSAQAHGASYNGHSLDHFSTACAWSFYPGKNLGCLGDGGAVTTNNDDLAKKIRILGNYGSTKKYIHSTLGFNSRLDPLQAAFLSHKLLYLNDHINQRNLIASKYKEVLSQLGIPYQHTTSNCTHSYHLFVALFKNRDLVMNLLSNSNIQTMIHYPVPPYKQRAYSQYFTSASYPVAEFVSDHCLSLPIGPHLSFEDVEFVCDTLRKLKPLPPSFL